MFTVGDRVGDITAFGREWPDLYGYVVKIDGSNILVKYDSGVERWKMWTNLIKIIKD